MVENYIPKGTERCIRRATVQFYMAPADLEAPVDTTLFRRSAAYGTRDVNLDTPEVGSSTYTIGCAVTDCECSIGLVKREGVTPVTTIFAQNMETCRRM